MHRPSLLHRIGSRIRGWLWGERKRIQAAQRLIDGNDFENARALLQSALKRLPNSAGLLLLRAQLLLKSGQLEMAGEQVKHALASPTITVANLFRAAELWEQLGEFDEAVAAYQRLSNHHVARVSAHAHYCIARLHLERDKPKALEHLTAAICRWDHVDAYTRLFSIRCNDVNALQSSLNQLQTHSSSNRCYRFPLAIADLLTKLKDFESATRQIIRAVHRRDSTDEFTDRLDTTQLRPSYLIIGAMKCGTTSLYDYISQHPNCLPAIRKEVHFFEKRDHPLDWYLAHFPRPTQSRQITGEASPGYLFHDIQQRISDDFPKIKLICILRHPTRRALSHFLHAQQKTRPRSDWLELRNNIQDFRVLSELDDDRAEAFLFQKMKDGCDRRIAFGFYYYFLRRWFRVFSPNQILLLKLDDLQRNPQATMQQVFQFLDVDSNFVCRFDIRNRGKETELSEVATRSLAELNQLYTRSMEKLASEFDIVFDGR